MKYLIITTLILIAAIGGFVAISIYFLWWNYWFNEAME